MSMINADHPRSRGVYELQSASPPSYTGSSPLARGLRVISAGRISTPRIIPARAGFTCGTHPRPCSRWDHPRSRGVYRRSSWPRTSGNGSSPLARGLPDIRISRGGGRGIIPARAGFTGQVGFHLGVLKDHPRSRGVYANIDVEALAAAGSSPLARGLPGASGGGGPGHRIIPARAGFTPSPCCATARAWDHPRSRGVY